VKCIQKHPLLGSAGSYNSVPLSYGGEFVAVGYENEQLCVYSEGQPWGGSYVYWEVKIVREGESFPDGMQFIGMVDDLTNPGAKLFIVGRING
jgi:hypothetical protein